VINVQLFVNGLQVTSFEKLKEERPKFSVVDATGKLYPIILKEDTLFTVDYKKVTKEWYHTGMTLFFSVPETTTGFKLKYRDLPLIDLGL